MIQVLTLFICAVQVVNITVPVPTYRSSVHIVPCHFPQWCVFSIVAVKMYFGISLNENEKKTNACHDRKRKNSEDEDGRWEPKTSGRRDKTAYKLYEAKAIAETPTITIYSTTRKDQPLENTTNILSPQFTSSATSLSSPQLLVYSSPQRIALLPAPCVPPIKRFVFQY
ncbi:unnamed protein product [Didymodactylos carnosus]|uniref:Uncharacterized protein n=1 Tax=Didymodactylos carnosus TaxID=1234261 RepID=A0A814BA48_9BILA|nr:unnamed protein product [Didymodactylos carnosus]CAF3705049.1 unnamed protein product [Didymodactylos carnosus]